MDRAALLLSLLMSSSGLPDSTLNATEVKWSSEGSGVYLGSPSILRCGNDSLLFSHDLFGAGPVGTAFVLRSDDGGSTWVAAGSATQMYWATLFSRPQDSATYLMGTSASNSSAQITIARSVDCGSSWSTAALTASPTAYSTGPTPVVLHAGRLWRAFEWNTGHGWAEYSTLVASAPVNASDLLSPAAWTLSGALPWSAVEPLVPPAWSNPAVSSSFGWLEGNAVQPVAATDDGIFIVLRVNSAPAANKAALVHVAGPSATPTFDSWIEAFPGGMSKFTIRQDARSGLYVTLSNYVEDARVTAPVSCAAGPPVSAGAPPGGPLPCCSMDQIRACSSSTTPSCWWCHANGRNNLTLAFSTDLRNWTLAPGLPVLRDDTGQPEWMSQMMTGFQYADWQFDGDDLIAAVRTSYRGAQCYHNSNRMLYQRIVGWRQLAHGTTPLPLGKGSQ
jgi:hypothetical protein